MTDPREQRRCRSGQRGSERARAVACLRDRMVRGLSLVLLLAVAGLGSRSALAEEKEGGLAFFENRIRPQLVEHCYECHSASAQKVKGGLRLDSRENLLKGGDSGPAVVAGAPEQSLLIRAIRHEDKDLLMPPGKGGSKKLPESTIRDFVEWVKMGSPFPAMPDVSADEAEKAAKKHWAFQPIRPGARPAVKNRAWPKQSIDYYILAALEGQGTQPAPAAERPTLLRRATFDLTGLPPTPEEMNAFLADESPDAFAKVVERLLNSRHYGEQWGRHWLDVVRYADTAGDTADYPVPTAWRYRNYVIDAFNADKPYDEFLREQIAGDILAEKGPRERYAERIVATGYLAISRRFGFDSENYHYLTIQDTIDTIGQSVLGLTVGCARCHNHKYDPITSTEYYGLYGIFESTRYAFPGSEQKAKYRALAPLIPPKEAQAKWRDLEARLAAYDVRPSAVLRSLHELDGDFEMQAVAAGGSKGVLVPPWRYEGGVAVSESAQSPYRNVHAPGKVGVSIPSGTNQYAILQKLPVQRRPRRDGRLHVNIDFRTSAGKESTPGSHRFWLGNRSQEALEVFISAEALEIRSSKGLEKVRALKPKQWYELQLAIEPGSGTFSGSAGSPGDVVTFSNKLLRTSWTGLTDHIGIDSRTPRAGALPALEIDNVSVQDTPFLSVTDSLARTVPSKKRNELPELNRRFQELVGMDGDFETQTDGTAPAKPWGPGPNSVVKIASAAQSPFRNQFGAGKLGIHLPRTPGYNGFGQTLTNTWAREKTERLYASFDFRCHKLEPGQNGSWRFYVGHGPGNSAAVELFLNRKQFFRGSGKTREAVCELREGQWYQVQVQLNLKEKTYQGTISSAEESVEFSGAFVSGWDGRVDYTFIDSYGHLAGVKPALDVDNYIVRESPLARLGAGPVQLGDASRNAEARELRNQLNERAAEEEQFKRELNGLLAEGPFDLAYSVTEGTPGNARLQVRGEPDRPGPEVPRGFLRVLDGGTLPRDAAGSGRLELAQWLTSPTNPLTARVMVNRIWQHHFGHGLVKTPNDFGTRGQRPTHPELLDHLAVEFIKSGWSVKAMHRLILLSAVYQQASAGSMIMRASRSTQKSTGTDAQGAAADTFSPYPRTRLSAEEIRDAILFVSGELDAGAGQGHPFPKATEWSFTQHAPFSAVYEHNKRSVYLMTQRIKRHPFLALFDGPDPNASTAERLMTTVPTQALFFLNDPFVHSKAEKFAARIQGAKADEVGQIELAYRLALGRRPTAIEREEASQFLAACRAELRPVHKGDVERAGLAAFARTLFGSNEFITVD